MGKAERLNNGILLLFNGKQLILVNYLGSLSEWALDRCMLNGTKQRYRHKDQPSNPEIFGI
jgi:hypothetical protein